MVDGARLESVYAGNRIEGSNPFLSSISLFCTVQYHPKNPHKHRVLLTLSASHVSYRPLTSWGHIHPKISHFTLSFPATCERRTRRYACPEPLILLDFYKTDLEVSYWDGEWRMHPKSENFTVI